MMTLRKLLILCAVTLLNVTCQNSVDYARNMKHGAVRLRSARETGSNGENNSVSATEKIITVTPTYETVSKIFIPDYSKNYFGRDNETKLNLPLELTKVKVLPIRVFKKRDVAATESGTPVSATEEIITVTPTHETISKIIIPDYSKNNFGSYKESKLNLPPEVTKVKVLPIRVFKKRDVAATESVNSVSATEKIITVTKTHETINKIIMPGLSKNYFGRDQETKLNVPPEVTQVKVLPIRVFEKRDVADKEKKSGNDNKEVIANTAKEVLETDTIPTPVYKVFASTITPQDNDTDEERPTKKPVAKTNGNQIENKTHAICETQGEREMDSEQCDAYYECIKGKFVKQLCPEGLVYNPETDMFNYPCQYIYEISCDGREKRQPAQPTEDCPHQYGYFRIGDEKSCDLYKSCVSGLGYDLKCSEGLAFNEAYNKCDWPDQVSDCDPELYLGFKCESQSGFFKNDADCKKYFICLNGKPRLQNCPKGKAFDSASDHCVEIKEIDGCE